MTEKDLKTLEKLLKAMGNARRLRILQILKERPNLGVGQIAVIIKLSFRATSRHLNKLYSQGIVDKKQVGLNIYYKIASNEDHLINIIIDKL